MSSPVELRLNILKIQSQILILSSCKLERCFYSSHIESFCLVFTSVTSAICHWFLPHTEWILVRHRVNQQTQAGDTNINYIQTITVTFN